MAARRTPLLPLFALALAAGGAWTFSAPYRAYAELKAAAREGDQQSLNALVDFPAFQASVKYGVRTSVEQGIADNGGGQLAGALGGLFAGAVASPLVDQVVTPRGMASLTQGFLPGEKAKQGVPSAAEESQLQVSRGFEDLSTFVIRFDDPATGRERVSLVMHRKGLTWRLRELRLPEPHQGEDEQ